VLSIYPLSGYGRMLTYDKKPLGVAWDGIYQLGSEERKHWVTKDDTNDELSPMEALDLVKNDYASNFERIEISEEEYYYKLDLADYYLVYEGKGASNQQYLFHLYEFVLGEPEEEIGHTVTYGWYHVDKVTGEITEFE
jgi:hypothetical protein